VQLAPFVEQAGTVAKQLGRRGPQVRRLVSNMRVLTRELGSRQNALRTLVGEGARTLSTLQAGSPDLDATLRELPGVQIAIDRSFAATRGVLGDVDDALRALDPVARELPTSLRALRTLGDDLRPTVRALQKPVGRLTPLATALAPLAGALDQAVTTLKPQAPTVNKVTRDLADCKKGVQNFFQWNVSMAKFGDARGPVPRGNVVLGAQSSGLFNDPQEYAPQACTPGRVIGGRVPTDKDKH
jgi:ABC-type transporter Mla subunit MlaD